MPDLKHLMKATTTARMIGPIITAAIVRPSVKSYSVVTKVASLTKVAITKEVTGQKPISFKQLVVLNFANYGNFKDFNSIVITSSKPITMVIDFKAKQLGIKPAESTVFDFKADQTNLKAIDSPLKDTKLLSFVFEEIRVADSTHTVVGVLKPSLFTTVVIKVTS